MKDSIGRAILLEAFEQGFIAGADSSSARRRHVVNPSTHDAWKAGHEAGRAARALALEWYERQLDR